MTRSKTSLLFEKNGKLLPSQRWIKNWRFFYSVTPVYQIIPLVDSFAWSIQPNICQFFVWNILSQPLGENLLTVHILALTSKWKNMRVYIPWFCSVSTSSNWRKAPLDKIFKNYLVLGNLKHIILLYRQGILVFWWNLVVFTSAILICRFLNSYTPVFPS